MKRFCVNMAVFCLLFWSVYGCSLDVETDAPLSYPAPELIPAPDLVPDMDYVPDVELVPETDLAPEMDPFPETDPVPEVEAPAAPPADEPAGDGVPGLVINELRTEASDSRSEFIEFRMLTDGNLYGLRVFIYRSGGGRTPVVFEFPSAVVKAGEYVVLHLRTLAGLTLDVSPTAHNFWMPGSTSRLNKTSAVYVLDHGDRVLGAVMLSEHPTASSWEGSNRAHFADIARFLFEQNAWKSSAGGIATPADAVITSSVGTAVTRSVSRDEAVGNTNTAADWYVTANNGATPGMPNDPRRLEVPQS